MTEQVRMKCANGDGILLNKYEDFYSLSVFDPEALIKFVQGIQYMKGDIVLCSYPKTGTHWMGNTLWQLKSLDADDRPQDKILEMGPPLAHQNSSRIFWTHLKPNHLHPSKIADKQGKIVLMLRNPKDAMVSMYYLLKNSTSFKNEQTWDEFFESYMKGEIILGSYFTYLRKWEDVLHDVSEGNADLQIELFYYEDYTLEPKATVQRLNKFLELDRDDDYLERVLAATTLGSLRERYSSESQLKHELTQDEAGNSVIFRKGVVGDWRAHLTVAQSERVDILLQDSLQHGIIKFKFDI